MNDFTLIDLFFLITGIAVIILTALIALVLINIFLFIRSLRRITKQAHSAAKIISEDIKEFGQKVKSEGLSFRSIINFLFGVKNSGSRIRKTKPNAK